MYIFMAEDLVLGKHLVYSSLGRQFLLLSMFLICLWFFVQGCDLVGIIYHVSMSIVVFPDQLIFRQS